MLRLSIRPTERGFTWTLTRCLGRSADVLARSARCLPDEPSCHRVVERLAEIPPGHAEAIPGVGGRWRWVVRDEDGLPLVESPTIFRSAGECRRAFADVQRDTWAVPVG